MSNTYDDKDLILPKIRIDSTNNQILFSENGVHLTASLTAGEYYCYKPGSESAAFQASYPSLYDEVISAINTVASNVYSVSIADPTAGISSDFTNSGLSLNRDSGANYIYGIITTSSANTFDPRFFGFNKSDNSLFTLTSMIGTTSLSGSYTRYGCWLSPRQHSSRLGTSVNVQYNNQGNYNVRQSVKWHTNKFRTLNYQWIYANHVSTWRNSRTEYALAGYLPLGTFDHGNYFNECWGLMSRGDDTLIIYNDGDVDLSVTNHPYEVVSLAREHLTELDSVRTRADANGEIYNIQFTVWRKAYEDMKTDYPSDVTNYFKED